MWWRQSVAPERLSVEWTLDPKTPADGAWTLARFIVRDSARRPVRGARLQVEGHMTHPGMAPVVAPLSENGDGVYETRLRFTMSGEWTLVVTGVLVNGEAVRHASGHLVIESSGH